MIRLAQTILAKPSLPMRAVVCRAPAIIAIERLAKLAMAGTPPARMPLVAGRDSTTDGTRAAADSEAVWPIRRALIVQGRLEQ